MNRYNRSDKPDWVPPRSIKLLDQVRERVRYLHYSLQTEKAYVYWAKAFVLWAARSHGGFRHPREMGQAEVEGFLTIRIPVVLTAQEVQTLLSHMAATEALLRSQQRPPPPLARSHHDGITRQNATLTPTVTLRPIKGAAVLMKEVWA